MEDIRKYKFVEAKIIASFLNYVNFMKTENIILKFKNKVFINKLI